jgi:glycosyltransferase involved in cell wall biosynthesis
MRIEPAPNRYVMVVQASAYPLDADRFATESAFAEHLRDLKASGEARFSKIVLIAPRMGDAVFVRQRDHLAIVEADRDGISLVSVPGNALSPTRAISQLRSLWRTIQPVVADAAMVHIDLATDVRHPMTALAGWAAKAADRPVVMFVDIDFRKHAERFRKLRYWGRVKYFYNRWIQQPFKAAQIRYAVRNYALVMLKSPSLVRDFGKGRPHVRNFYDTVHAEAQVLSREEHAARSTVMGDPRQPLRLCYFGRLVDYKGIDRMIQAVAAARAQGGDAALTIIGDGPNRAALETQAAELGLANHVQFVGQVAYGAPLFEMLRDEHVMLATPLIEDTPRAAFDAMARGLPIVAFDISYFRDLGEASGAVAVARWPDAAALAETIV